MLKINKNFLITATTFGSLANLISVTPADAAAACIPGSEMAAKIAAEVELNGSVNAADDAVVTAVSRLRSAKAREAAARTSLNAALETGTTSALKTAKAAYTKARSARITAQNTLSSARKRSESVRRSVHTAVENEFSFYLCADNRVLGLASASGNGYVTLSWRVVEGASRYLVRKDGLTAGVVNGTSFVDSKSGNGVEHTYKVYAMSMSAPEDAEEQVDPFEYTNHTVLTEAELVAQGTLPAPVSLTVSTTTTSAQLMWSAVQNSTGYQVLRNGEVVATTLGTNYVDAGLRAGTNYAYSVRAVQGGVVSIATPERIASTIAVTLAAPTGLRTVAADGSVALSWTAVSGATGYNVYRDGQLIDTTVASAFTDTMAETGVTYSYDVTATAGATESSHSLPANGYAKISAPTGLIATPANLSVSLAWSAVAGADSYQVLRNGTLIANVVDPAYVDSSVSNGTLYTYTVRTIIGTVSSAASASAVAMPASLILAVPSNIVASPADGRVTLTWNPVNQATHYQVLRNGTVIALPASATFTDTGLTNGVTYSYTLKAINGANSSMTSIAVTAVPTAGVPSAPTGLTATAGNQQVNLAWTAVPGATSYRISRNGVVLATSATASYLDSTVTNGVTYSYTVAAINALGSSAESSSASVTPAALVLSAPTGLAASAGNAQISLSWTAVANATSYEIYRNSTLLGTSATASYVDRTAVNGTAYSYAVKAINGGTASALSNSVTATATAPTLAAPTGVSATAGDAQVSITWTAVSGATSYQVLRNGVLIASPTTNAHIDTGVVNGTTYSYTIKAVNGTSTSVASSAATATPSAPLTQLTTPTGLVANSATALSTGALRLQWDAVAGATGYTIFKDGVQLATSATNSYTIAAPTFGVRNSYHVVATNGVPSNTSAPSATITTGVYRGIAVTDARGREVYGQIQVYAIMTGTALTGCWATYPTTSDSGPINRSAIPNLCTQALTKQPTSATVSTLITNVSGATATTPAFKGSLQDALTQAGR